MSAAGHISLREVFLREASAMDLDARSAML